MVPSVEVMIFLCRLELMTGSGRRRSAMEMGVEGEDLQTEVILTPEDNRYLENSYVTVSCHLPVLHVLAV